MLVGVYSPLYTHAYISFPVSCDDNITISISEDILQIIPGTMCIKCVFGGEVAADAEYQIGYSEIDRITGRVVDGVLEVFDTESVLTTSSATVVQCMSVDLNARHSVRMYLESKSHYIATCHPSII